VSGAHAAVLHLVQCKRYALDPLLLCPTCNGFLCGAGAAASGGAGTIAGAGTVVGPGES